MTVKSPSTDRRPPRRGVSPSAFELVTRARVEDLTRHFDRLDQKVNGILIGVILMVLSQAWDAFNR